MPWNSRVIEGGFETIDSFPEACCASHSHCSQSGSIAMPPRLQENDPSSSTTSPKRDDRHHHHDQHHDDGDDNDLVRSDRVLSKRRVHPSHPHAAPASGSSSSCTSSSPPPIHLHHRQHMMPRVPSLADLEVGARKQPITTQELLGVSCHMVKKTRDYPRRRRKLSSFFLRLVRTRPDLLDPAVTIPLLNGIDMFAVSLVVPLLFQYYKAAGVTSANQRELLSSVFSASQIFGGLLLGTLSDAKLVRRKTVLLVSFGGSAVSYALIVFGGLYAILLSRVLVGLVKQTMTVCTAILTRHTTKTNRAHILGRLTASSTVAWIVGPTVGAMLYKYVDPRAPALVACLLFVGNVLLAMIVLAPDDGSNDEDDDYSPSPVPAMDHPPSPSGTTTIGSNKPSHTSTSPSKCSVILNNLRVCFSSKALGSAVITKLLLTWITKATNYSQLGSFYEDMYGLEPHHRGYISSYQQLLQFFVNIRLVSPILDYAGGERWATLYCVSIMAAAVYLESFRSLPLFLVVLCPIISLSFCISDLSLQTLVTHVAPPSSMFSVLAALDVLQNMVSVSVPFYRTWLFSHLQKGATTGAMMQGDPDPVAWVKSSSLHWCVTAAVLSLLLTNESWWIEDHRHHVKMPSKKGR